MIKPFFLQVFEENVNENLAYAVIKTFNNTYNYIYDKYISFKNV